MIVPFPQTVVAGSRMGRNLRKVRKARGLSLGRLATEAQLDPTRLSSAEDGHVRLNAAELHAVINALHLPLGFLFSPPDDLSRLRKL